MSRFEFSYNMFQMKHAESRLLVAIIVYISLFLDNILLTVIVPILPDYLSNAEKLPASVVYKNYDMHYVSQVMGETILPAAAAATTKNSSLNQHIEQGTSNVSMEDLNDENASIGMLLGIKAIIQLIFNPIVGGLTTKFGYRLPLLFGTVNLLVASLVFAIGQSYWSLFFARAIQGIGSACLNVCGMSLIAHLYPEDEKRSKVMGIILGSVALGVLFGYPFGGLLYDFAGKSVPFYTIAVVLFLNLVLQINCIEFHVQTESGIGGETSSWWPLLSDQTITLIACAIWISTSAMAILEPCLPIWLMQNLHPKKWQIGTVFVPDSLGYFLGTNFCGSFAYRHGQIRIAVISLLIVGLSCILIPNASSISGLLIPHFGLGLGIGALDSALVPLLASAVDAKFTDNDSISSNSISNYGAVYAIQQMAVSLAYSVAPMVGGEMAKLIGFPWLIRLIGVINLSYGPFFMYQSLKAPSIKKTNHILLRSSDGSEDSYKRFYDTID
ncbi:synaptic vesicular amine transporter [Culicoides brevitarsis]|uniref:synaptic vesicular amine transporter n=1 Tax=Culicoides brevitarsis TaxID=469753 RepID=UPI00307B1D7B